jgi:hypothetical protein
VEAMLDKALSSSTTVGHLLAALKQVWCLVCVCVCLGGGGGTLTVHRQPAPAASHS